MARDDPTQDALPLLGVAHLWCRCPGNSGRACQLPQSRRCRRTYGHLADERVYNALLREVDAHAQPRPPAKRQSELTLAYGQG